MEPTEKQKLIAWYLKNKRPLPWRKTSDPYKIWISETMLQQTTSTAVIPYYKKFINELPSVESLASAPQDQVLSLWAGLGYYSRARNLQTAAQQIVATGGFPKTFSQLKEFKGIGDYTSRAVASIAFGEVVGVVDGNVIRFFSRYYNWSQPWWNSKGKNHLQSLADNFVKDLNPKDANQTLMEMGATLCTPKNPQCLLCPVAKTCKGRSKGNELSLPIKKAKTQKEIWLLQLDLYQRSKNGKKQIALTKTNDTPFLKGQWLLPNRGLKNPKQAKYDFKHFITKYEILVKATKKRSAPKQEVKWVDEKDIKKYCPSSLITKSLSQLCLFLFFIGFLNGCGTSPKNEEIQKNMLIPGHENLPQINDLKKLTHQGSNFFSHFINEQNVLFVKSNFKTAPHQQIYTLNLSTSEEKNLTHQYGKMASPLMGNNSLYFLSSNDEDKERPDFLNQLINKAQPQPKNSLFDISFFTLHNYELYTGTPQARHIHRLTHDPGFDGFLYLDEKHKMLYYSHLSANGSQVYRIDPSSKAKTKSQKLWNSSEWDIFVQPSPGLKYISFVRWNPKQQKSQIFLRETKKRTDTPLDLPFEKFFNPIWIEDGKALVFSALLPDSNNIELFYYQLSSNCLRRLTYLTGFDLWPSIHNQTIIFSNNHSGQFDLFSGTLPGEEICAVSSVKKPLEPDEGK